MNSVSVRTVVRVFGEAHEPTVFSDRMTSSGFRTVALILASKSDHSAYGKGIRWPIFKTSDIAEKLRMSPSTVERTIRQLKRDGFIQTTKTKQGNRYEFLAPVFEGDTYRGKPNISHKAKSLIEMSVITADISDEAFHLLYMMEATAKSWPSVRLPQSKLRTYFKSPRPRPDAADPYISLRQLNTWLRELEGIGLLERHRPGQMEQNEYILNKERFVVNGVDYGNMVVVPAQLASAQNAAVVEPVEDRQGTQSLSGMDLAKEFRQEVRRMHRDPEWGNALSREDAFNLPALAKTINHWLSDGLTVEEVREMIGCYTYTSNINTPPEYLLGDEARKYVATTPIWIDFISIKDRLLERVLKRADRLRDEAEADDDPFSPENRLATYLSRMAS
ncbi:winged helix-turn-helix domain-containing protein [Nonomuraea terrae]|uniref:winged helix-turn-helix domain-containing protein n=1 Tax=Nonomuraea terrae TaxID=2530383 RepID=UPI00379FC377